MLVEFSLSTTPFVILYGAALPAPNTRLFCGKVEKQSLTTVSIVVRMFGFVFDLNHSILCLDLMFDF